MLVIFENVLFGIVLNIVEIYHGQFRRCMDRIFRAMKYQTIIISDSASFSIQNEISTSHIIRTVFAYIAYLLPTIGLLFLFWAARSNSIVCRLG